MINRNIKSILLRFPLTSGVYRYAAKQYAAHVFNVRCRKLQAIGPAIIKILHETLEGSALDYFADYGTLLGVIRESNFIRHDDDLDFSVPAKHKDPYEYYLALSKVPGLVFSKAFEWEGRIRQLVFEYKGIDVDYFFMYEENGIVYSQYYNRLSDFAYEREQQWTAYRMNRGVPGKLLAKEFRGTVINVPENYDKLLTAQYGNWRVPMRAFKGNGNEKNMGQSLREIPKSFAVVVGLDRVKELFESHRDC